MAAGSGVAASRLHGSSREQPGAPRGKAGVGSNVSSSNAVKSRVLQGKLFHHAAARVCSVRLQALAQDSYRGWRGTAPPAGAQEG